MDVKILNPFLEATLEVARTMAQLDISVGKPAVKKGDIAQGDATGFIQLSGANYKGSLAISFNQEALKLVYEKMLGESLSEIDDSALDLVGEITNMVCGGAKQRLSESGMDFVLTQPQLLSGDQHHIRHLTDSPVLTLPLQLEQGCLMLEVNLEAVNSPLAASK